jgi:hypothetical protein
MIKGGCCRDQPKGIYCMHIPYAYISSRYYCGVTPWTFTKTSFECMHNLDSRKHRLELKLMV